jgi:chromosome segregation ATPase
MIFSLLSGIIIASNGEGSPPAERYAKKVKRIPFEIQYVRPAGLEQAAARTGKVLAEQAKADDERIEDLRNALRRLGEEKQEKEQELGTKDKELQDLKTQWLEEIEVLEKRRRAKSEELAQVKQELESNQQVLANLREFANSAVVLNAIERTAYEQTLLELKGVKDMLDVLICEYKTATVECGLLEQISGKLEEEIKGIEAGDVRTKLELDETELAQQTPEVKAEVVQLKDRCTKIRRSIREEIKQAVGM